MTAVKLCLSWRQQLPIGCIWLWQEGHTRTHWMGSFARTHVHVQTIDSSLPKGYQLEIKFPARRKPREKPCVMLCQVKARDHREPLRPGVLNNSEISNLNWLVVTGTCFNLFQYCSYSIYSWGFSTPNWLYYDFQDFSEAYCSQYMKVSWGEHQPLGVSWNFWYPSTGNVSGRRYHLMEIIPSV